MRRGHPHEGRDLNAAAFAALPQVLVSPSGEPSGPVDEALAALGLARRIALVVPDHRLALEAIAASDLVGTLAEGPARRLGGALELVRREPPVRLAPQPVDLIASRESGDLVGWLATLLRQVVADDG